MGEKTITFDDGFHRRMWSAGRGEDNVQQYYPQPHTDIGTASALDRIRQERRECAALVEHLHADKKTCAAEKRFDDARLIGNLAKEYEGWVKAATWLLGYYGDGKRVEPKDWNHELWPQLDGLIAMAELAA